MCGIFLLLNSESSGNDVSNEFNKGINRGPDASKFIKLKNLYIGFHRLAINGLDDKGMQPFNKKGVYMICNGEIYNYNKLYTLLDIKPETTSDCEIILDLYLKFDIEFTIKNLDGVFSFIIVDTVKDCIYIGRDPFGVRPLFYFHDYNNKSIGISSELKTINSFNRNINQYPPGNYSILDTNFKLTTTKYFTLNTIYSNIINTFSPNITYYESMIYESLINSVSKRLLSDRPIACLLSGGLDSSLITSIVCKLMQPKIIETFSIGLEGSTDLKYAQIVANHLGTKHTNIILTEEQFFNSIPEVIKAIESYDTTTVRASVGNYLIAKYISKHSDAKVIFNGDGSDELTGGYLYFHNSPNILDSEFETERLLKDISYFDVLRSDKSISSCGLEPRTPFLDKSFVQLYRSIPINLRFKKGEIEKKLLRDSFKDLLPDEVLYRKKEAFSDGVSSMEKSWFSIIQEKVSNIKFNCPHVNWNIPMTLEQKYYRFIFENEYPNKGKIIPYYWMPKWSNTNDPSARTL